MALHQIPAVVEDTGDGILLKPKRPFSRTTIKVVAGCLKYCGPPKTLEEMNDSLRKGCGSNGVIAIDTNIVLRFLTQDDNIQCKKAFRLFNNLDLFIPDTVILETERVSRFAYNFSPAEIIEVFRQLFGLANAYVENGPKLAKVINWYERGLGFADSFYLASSEQLSDLVTFDEKFVKQAKDQSTCGCERPNFVLIGGPKRSFRTIRSSQSSCI